MNRWIWIVRIFGILMIVGFFLLFAYMQKRLVDIQNTRESSPASTR